jgi:hypothetical protein
MKEEAELKATEVEALLRDKEKENQFLKEKLSQAKQARRDIMQQKPASKQPSDQVELQPR